MTYVTVSNPTRPLQQITADTFADLTTVPFVRVFMLGHNAVLQFDGDLDVATQSAIADRCQAVNDAQYALRQQAAAALQACRTYLANPAPTQADALAQIQLLTQIVIRLARLTLNELDGTN